MDINIIECVAGTTLRVTCRLADGNADATQSVLLSGSETLVSTAVGVSSGNGMYYALHTVPNSDSWYVNEWRCRFGVNTYVDRQYVRADKRSAGV